MSYHTLYKNGDTPNSLYFVESGDVFFYLNNHDKYKLNGKKILIGTLEVIINDVLKIPTTRLETTVFPETTKLKILSKESFLENLNKYSYLLNIALVLANKVRFTNCIINKNQSILTQDTMSLQNICKEYYTIMSIVLDEYEKRKIPWLKKIVKEYENTITYVKGQSFNAAETPVKITTNESLSENYIDIPKDQIIFNEGDNGNELYILESGTLCVIVNNHKVATINEPGTIIGEMALLLGEKRTATLKSASEVRLTRIKKEDLKKIAENDIDTFLNIVYSLAKKAYMNIVKIGDINSSIINKTMDEEQMGNSKLNEIRKSETELSKLKYELNELLFKQDAPFLKERFSNVQIKL